RQLASQQHDAIHATGVRAAIADAFLDTGHGDVRPLIDLFDLGERLSDINHHAAAAVAAAARDLLTLLKPGGDLVVEHKAAVDLEGLHGLGVFAPSVTGAAELTRLELSEQSYNALGLVKDTEWVSLVFEDLKNLLEPLNKVVAEFVNDTGATGRED